MMTGYKFIQEDMKSKNGDHKWILNKWYKLDEDKIKLCNYGFHACIEPRGALEFVYGNKFFIIEARGKIIHDEKAKFVASEMRLIKELPTSQIFKKFAIWTAKQCVSNYEKEYPNDSRVSDCIKASEDYLDGKITLDELTTAQSAAWSAWSAAWSTAWSAAQSAAWSAARSAWSAWSAAQSAARSPQSAARSAWSAAQSAWSARSAARSAAQSAARSAQNKFLKQLIKKYNRSTIDVKLLRPDEIFIFGSNEAGKHDAGAAKLAKDKFKAKYGVGEGLTGKCYAFPTLDKDFKKLSVYKLKKSVNKLNKCAKDNPFKIFLLTKVGCGIAGYNEKEISNLFKNIELNIIKPEGW